MGWWEIKGNVLGNFGVRRSPLFNYKNIYCIVVHKKRKCFRSRVRYHILEILLKCFFIRNWNPELFLLFLVLYQKKVLREAWVKRIRLVFITTSLLLVTLKTEYPTALHNPLPPTDNVSTQHNPLIPFLQLPSFSPYVTWHFSIPCLEPYLPRTK